MVTYPDVLEAKKRISPYVIRTPLLRAPGLDQVLGCEVYLKPENLQYTNSFKLRGATNRLLCLSEEEKKRGVICSSSGNHAQGVACAAYRLGLNAKIVMPEYANQAKLDGVRAFGAELILSPLSNSEYEKLAQNIAQEEGRVMVHPYNDAMVQAGQGTIGLEILEDNPDIDAVVLPIGGGGLSSGVSCALKGTKPGIKVYGVEPQGAPRYSESIKQGKAVSVAPVDTICDGTRTDKADPDIFAFLQKTLDDIVTVPDETVKTCMLLYLRYAKLLCEPSSSLPIAAAYAQKLPTKGQKVCFVISGGNNDLALIRKLLESEGF